MSKTVTKKQVFTDPIMRKSHKHNVPEFTPVICPNCKGEGECVTNHNFKQGPFSKKEECTVCGGAGEVYE